MFGDGRDNRTCILAMALKKCVLIKRTCKENLSTPRLLAPESSARGTRTIVWSEVSVADCEVKSFYRYNSFQLVEGAEWIRFLLTGLAILFMQ